jgi:hypothetical protein
MECILFISKYELGFCVLCRGVISLSESWALPSENQEHMEEKYYEFVCFQTLLYPFLLQTETLPSVTQFAALPKNCRLYNILFEMVKFRHLIDPRGKKHFPRFVVCQNKFGIYLPFTYLFQFIITSCELFFAFRRPLVSDLTLTRAIHLISAYVLNTVYRQ